MAFIKRYVDILNLFIITFVIYFGADIFYTAIRAKTSYIKGGQDIIQTKDSESSDKVMLLSDYSSISRRNLFDIKTPFETDKSKIDVDDLEKTSLNLKLLGTVFSKDEYDSCAVIQDLSIGKHDIYRVGDFIKDNASLKMILREKVVLEVNGKDEVLDMSSEQDISASKNLGPYTDEEGVVSLEREEINKSIKDAGSLMRQIRIKPTKAGFKLMQVAPDSIFRKMGLKPGDIITGVNGEEMKSVDDALKFYNELKDSDAVGLQIKRGKESSTLKYNIR